MQRDGWQTAKDLFRLALEQPAGDRVTFVEKKCADVAIRDEVLRLLRFHDEPSAFLESPVAASPRTAEGGADELIGRNLGGFVIVRRIGMGGMGAVYEARQEQPRRNAAVKVLRPGALSLRMQRRFEFESDVLARLDHPGIARVFAAGTFEAGRGVQPWFAMELVDGPSIKSYVANQSPSRAGLLALLAAVCDAVQHAHQRGVVHRDLKPDNILITRSGDGASVQPKILDFGVARSMEADAQVTMHTVAGEIIGTLAYMSPEQLSGDPERVDARCDVFSLGVIGYELLGGRLPHGDGRGSIAQMVQAIEQKDPVKLGAIDPGLRGDIEVILAKALEKDVSRRYASAAEFAADLRRHMNNEPVSARPATTAYQLTKFARRNRALVGGAMTTVAALTAGLVLYAVEARTARREAEKSRYEADKATAINNFMTNDFLMKLLAAANKQKPGERLAVGQLVAQASAQAGLMFNDQPLAEAAVRNEIGSIHYNLGTVEQAAAEFERALDLWQTHLGPDHVDTLKAVNNLGQVRARQRRPSDAEALYVRALEGRRRALGEDDPYTLVTMNNLAEVYRGAGRLDEAEGLLRRALAAQERVHGSSHKNTITTLGNLGSLLAQRGRHEDAVTMHRRAYEASRSTLGDDHVMTAMTGVRYGLSLQKVNRPDEAEPLLLSVAASAERSMGPGHPETINTRRVLARGYRQQRKYGEAAEQLRRALAGAKTMTEGPAGMAARIQQELDGVTTPAARSEGAASRPARPGSVGEDEKE